jgi:hypothetical protein
MKYVSRNFAAHYGNGYIIGLADFVDIKSKPVLSRKRGKDRGHKCGGGAL